MLVKWPLSFPVLLVHSLGNMRASDCLLFLGVGSLGLACTTGKVYKWTFLLLVLKKLSSTMTVGDHQGRNLELTSQDRGAQYPLSRLPSSCFARLPFSTSQSRVIIAVWG